jgi:polyhydroxyalkanoate synthesis repressor PhaR
VRPLGAAARRAGHKVEVRHVTAPRLIKKYPNRRLYDTELSRYITLVDIRDLVLRGVDFHVMDTNTNEDITRQILMQIIMEEESGGRPLFSASMLAQIIRFYGGTVQGLFTRFLEESMSLFARNQDQMRHTLGADPLEAMGKLAQRNLELWTTFQDSFLKAAGLGSVSGTKPPGDPPDQKPS